MLTKILIILFFIVLALKPAYIMFSCVEVDGSEGTIVTCTPLIVALYTKIKFFPDVYIINGRMYDQIYNKYFKQKEENQ